jgi:hypothetical protein
MSFMRYARGTPYAYRVVDGGLFIAYAGRDVEIPWERAEELAAMIWHGIEPERRREVLERTAEEHAGNFGCDPVLAELGLRTAAQMMAEQVETMKEGRGDGQG